MLQLGNNTPFAANMAVFPDPDGVDTLYLVVRAGFDIAPRATLTDEQPAPPEADVYWAEPGRSSLKYVSDYHIGKAGTDIAMIGLACAPSQKMVTSLDVNLSLGGMGKTVRVFGDRQWRDGQATRPTPFQTMPMVYEKAFGGVQIVDGEADDVEVRNPVGCGFSGNRGVADMDGVPLPNLEDPRHLIRDCTDRPPPAGFGFCSPEWQPRAGFAGTYDQRWQRERAPYLPEDFDLRFLNMAHPDLICTDFLQGGEAVSISGMHPEGQLDFALPRVDLFSRLKLGDQTHQAEFRLETLLFEPNRLQMSMVWKAAYSCDKRINRIDEIGIGLRH